MDSKSPKQTIISMKNHDADELVDAMFDMGEETMRLLFEEKMRFEQGDDVSFGYAAILV